MGSSCKVYSDGASRGNPGLAAAGWVIVNAEDEVVVAAGAFLGTLTNNEAEYQAAILGLQAAQAQGYQEVGLYADSQLLVRQLTGQYQVRHPRILPLYAQLKALTLQFARFKAHHIERAEELDPAWFVGKTHIGITAGTSTPQDVIEAVQQRVRELTGLVSV